MSHKNFHIFWSSKQIYTKITKIDTIHPFLKIEKFHLNYTVADIRDPLVIPKLRL